jgi:hypothetical protein
VYSREDKRQAGSNADEGQTFLSDTVLPCVKRRHVRSSSETKHQYFTHKWFVLLARLLSDVAGPTTDHWYHAYFVAHPLFFPARPPYLGSSCGRVLLDSLGVISFDLRISYSTSISTRVLFRLPVQHSLRVMRHLEASSRRSRLHYLTRPVFLHVSYARWETLAGEVVGWTEELNCVGVSFIRYLQQSFFETSSLQDRNFGWVCPITLWDLTRLECWSFGYCSKDIYILGMFVAVYDSWSRDCY